jgi:hypothetical protein
MARRKRTRLPVAREAPWRPEAITADPVGGDDLDALLDAALLDAMARQSESDLPETTLDRPPGAVLWYGSAF